MEHLKPHESFTSKLRYIVFVAFLSLSTIHPVQAQDQVDSSEVEYADLRSLLDSIWISEQVPIRKRDSLLKIYGADHPLVEVQQQLYKKNHLSNQRRIEVILKNNTWPLLAARGERGNLIICNVLQHSDEATRRAYLPLMRSAVEMHKLEPYLLARAEDRLATDANQLQIYGGQIKYYPETKSFDVWPIYDPVNVDKRRKAIGLGPIADFLKNRFDLEWNVEEQIRRTELFLKEREE